MKIIIATIFLFAVCWNVEAFTPEEIEEILCSVPDKYLLRYVGCLFDNSAAPFQKFANAIHECIDERYESNGRSYSYILFMCGDVQKDEDLRNCLTKKGEQIEEPTQAEVLEFVTSQISCLTTAK